MFTNVCLYVCEGEREHKREANLSDSIKHLAGPPLTYSTDTNLAFCVWSGTNMSLGSAVSLITLETCKNSRLVFKVLLFGKTTYCSESLGSHCGGPWQRECLGMAGHGQPGGAGSYAAPFWAVRDVPLWRWKALHLCSCPGHRALGSGSWWHCVFRGGMARTNSRPLHRWRNGKRRGKPGVRNLEEDKQRAADFFVTENREEICVSHPLVKFPNSHANIV